MELALPFTTNYIFIKLNICSLSFDERYISGGAARCNHIITHIILAEDKNSMREEKRWLTFDFKFIYGFYGHIINASIVYNIIYKR